ncbi:SWI/SNF COMPLEX SUBUNIT SWI3D [Salix koriyanagi]|uniref:SWI/SNF COMPLEX SUBUNIT SWI3D n=1 Tax=Salix koriyanagi TaxID=2511006 RepID=A0A9Q0ZLP7_9ROSI|nr:SWI/SNF COMPLEX SUBUNIT SWI3D [Salix koriyanagi]
MEEKPAWSYADSPASYEPATSRRRAGGLKRKVNSLSNSLSSPLTSKRPTREKAAVSNLSIHNGPLTRARQIPNILASSASSAGVKIEQKVVAAVPDAAAVVEEERRSRVEELQAEIEAEFEVIRSRDSNAHVVPNHCGWFSWSKIHSLEERLLPSFFNGKSQSRTPDTYLDIRNWILKKFHANPNTLIEVKDLSELEVSDSEARQEVLEFLDYWGLINFHPLQLDPVTNADGDEAAKKDLSLEKLFRFEAIQTCPPVVTEPNFTAPTTPSKLFPESAIAEELAKLEGPSVEYHCNSCSADCSRKRYHCQKEADYDLCADCFNNRKFGSNMSSSDFILMEPAEAAGVSGGKWTDQETLLLLEALELYKENWNEIAEHVATKTKAQCILHFVQMPIEDAFFDCAIEMDGTSKETADADATIDDTSAPKDVLDTSESKTGANEDQHLTAPIEASKPDETIEVQVCQGITKDEKSSEVINGQETSKSEDVSGVKAGEEMGENVALRALTEAFEAVGYSPTPENRLSFSDVGNPVMAVALFLARLAGPDAATASACSSLKSLSSNSPGMQLASRHCFLLEDPPDERKKQSCSDCVATEMADQDALKDKQEGKSQKGNCPTSGIDNKDLLDDYSDKKVEDSIPEEKKSLDSSKGEFPDKEYVVNGGEIAVTHEEVEPGRSKKSSNSELPKDHSPSIVKESDEIPAKSGCPPSSGKEPQEVSSAEEHSQLTEVAKDVDMVSNLKPLEKNGCSQSFASMSVDEPSQAADVSRDVDMVSDSLPADNNGSQQPVKSNATGEQSQITEATADVDMSSSRPTEVREPLDPKVESGATADEAPKDSNIEKLDSEVIKDDNSIDKLKRAAISALSAAAVKAKLLANQEEDQIRELAASLIEKQLHKLETKLAFFNEMDSVIMRVREQLDRSRQRLYQERAQIIATRLGLPPSSRAMPPSLPSNRIAMNFANAFPRPPMNLASQRPPISIPMGTLGPTPSGTFVSTTTAGNSIRPSSQDKISSIGTK